MKTLLLFFTLLMTGACAGQSIGYGGGRPKKGPDLPPVSYAQKKDSLLFTHQALTIVVDYVVDEKNTISGMKVVEIKGDTSDKAYVNECILKVFNTIRTNQGEEIKPVNPKAKVKVKFRLPVNIPAN